MQLTKGHNIVLARRIIWIEPERIGVGHQTDVAAAKLAVRPGQMKIKAELLGDDMDKNRIFCRRKFIHAFRPKRDGESQEQNRFDEDYGKFQMS